MNTFSRQMGAQAAAVLAFMAPNAAAVISPESVSAAFPAQDFGDKCGPVLIEDESVDPRLASAVVSLGMLSVDASNIPQVDLHVHYLNGGEYHQVTTDSGFDRYIAGVMKDCKFDNRDVLVTLVKYTDAEKAAYDRRFGNFDISMKSASGLNRVYDSTFFREVQPVLSDNLADKSTPEQQDLAVLVDQMTDAYVEEMDQVKPTHDNTPSAPSEQPVANNPNGFTTWLKENWQSLSGTLLGMAMAGAGLGTVLRKRKINGELRMSTREADSIVRQISDLLDGKSVTAFAGIFADDSYPSSQQIATGLAGGKNLEDTTYTPQDKGITHEIPDDNDNPILDGLSSYADFAIRFSSAKEKEISKLLSSLESDAKINKLIGIREELLAGVREIFSLFTQLDTASKGVWPDRAVFDALAGKLDSQMTDSGSSIAAYETLYRECKQAADQSRDRFNSLAESLEWSKEEIARLRKTGWDVDVLEKEWVAHEQYHTELLHRTAREPISASEAAAAYADTMGAFRDRCSRIEERYSANTGLHTQRQTTLERLDRDLARAAETLGGLVPTSQTGYHESCTADIAHRDTDLSQTLEHVKALQTTMGNRLTEKSVSTLDLLDTHAADFATAVDKFDSFAREIAGRASLLAELKEELPQSVRELDGTLDSYVSHAADWGIDVDDEVREALAAKRSLIKDLETALNEGRPKYLGLNHSLAKAKTTISSAYETARGQHQAAEQLRSNIVSTSASIESLEREIRSFYASNGRYLYGGAPSYSYSTSTHGNRGELKDTLDDLKSIRSSAESDLEDAKSTVHRKKAEEEAERRRRKEEKQRAAAAASSISRTSSSGGMSGNRGGV